MNRLYTIQRAAIRRVRLIGLMGVIGAVGVVQAQAGSIASFIGGSPLVCGDKSFTFTAFNSVDSGGAIAPTSSQVFVTGIDCGTSDPGILVQSADWNVNQAQTIDTTFTYNIISSGPSIVDASLATTSDGATDSSSNPSLGGDIHITESLFNTSSVDVGNLLNDYQQNLTSETVNFAPVSELTVNKDVSLEGNTDGTATLSTFTQNFSETPEPGTVSMLGLGFIGIALTRLRKNDRPTK